MGIVQAKGVHRTRRGVVGGAGERWMAGNMEGRVQK